MKKSIILSSVLCISIIFLTGCFDGEGTLAKNETKFSLKNIGKLKISYDEGDVSFLKGESDQLVIREYLSEDKKHYRAKIKKKGRTIQLSEGKKPLFDGDFVRSLEIYLPKDYDQDLNITTTDGNIDLSDIETDFETLSLDSTEGMMTVGSIEASQIKVTSTRGTLNFDQLTAEHIHLETTEGTVRGDQLNGKITYVTTHGDFDVKDVAGAGNFTVNNSGSLAVNFSQVTGDIWLYNKNDGIRLTLPKELSFYFESATKNGQLSASFFDQLKVGEKSASGTVGDKPKVTVRMETRNGSLDVIQ